MIYKGLKNGLKSMDKTCRIHNTVAKGANGGHGIFLDQDLQALGI
jgi:hypothetical protein